MARTGLLRKRPDAPFGGGGSLPRPADQQPRRAALRNSAGALRRSGLHRRALAGRSSPNTLRAGRIAARETTGLGVPAVRRSPAATARGTGTQMAGARAAAAEPLPPVLG